MKMILISVLLRNFRGEWTANSLSFALIEKSCTLVSLPTIASIPMGRGRLAWGGQAFRTGNCVIRLSLYLVSPSLGRRRTAQTEDGGGESAF